MNRAARIERPLELNPALKLAIRLALLLVIIGPLVHLLKVARIAYDVGAVLFYTGFPTIILLLIFGGLWEPNNPERRAKVFPVLLLVMLVAAAVMTGHYQGDIADIAGNVLRLAFVFVCVFFLTNSADAYVAFLNDRLFWISKLALITTTGATLLMHMAALVGFSVYFGLQTTGAFIALAYGLVYQRLSIAFLAFVPLIGSGKRGAMMGAIAILIAYIAMAAGRVKMQRLVALAAGLGVSFVILYVFQLLPAAILHRIDFLFTDADVDLNTVSAGRYLEAATAIGHLNDHPMAWLTGFGLGSAINLTQYAGSTVSTVHFSPLAMIMIFGVPLTLLFYGALISYLISFFRICRAGWVPREFVVMFLVVVAEIAFSLTAFSILQSYLLWIALTYLIAARQTFPEGAAARIAAPASAMPARLMHPAHGAVR